MGILLSTIPCTTFPRRLLKFWNLHMPINSKNSSEHVHVRICQHIANLKKKFDPHFLTFGRQFRPVINDYFLSDNFDHSEERVWSWTSCFQKRHSYSTGRQCSHQLPWWEVFCPIFGWTANATHQNQNLIKWPRIRSISLRESSWVRTTVSIKRPNKFSER